MPAAYGLDDVENAMSDWSSDDDDDNKEDAKAGTNLSHLLMQSLSLCVYLLYAGSSAKFF